MKKPELLVPAGNIEKLKAALHFGADAVYLAGREFSLRARAGNFTLEDMGRAINLAREKGVRVYVAVNALAVNLDIERLPAYLNELKRLRPDALIVSDPGVFYLARRLLPDTPIHLSTQANTTNRLSCEFWKRQGVTRLGLARELSMDEIEEISKNTDAELEVFVHGAMCISYSGRCWMSRFMAGRDANRGDCAQSCRWEYFLTESKRPGEYFPVEGDEKGTYLFNSKDLCWIDYLPRLIKAGVNALKIEGRMKTAYYVGVVTNVYRAAIDSCRESPDDFSVLPEWRRELESVSHRGYTVAFAEGSPDSDRLLHTFSPYRHFDFVGTVLGSSPSGSAKVGVKNRFSVGDEVEVVSRGLAVHRLKLGSIRDEEGNSMKSAKPNTLVLIGVNGIKLEENSLIRKRIEE